MTCHPQPLPNLLKAAVPGVVPGPLSTHAYPHLTSSRPITLTSLTVLYEETLSFLSPAWPLGSLHPILKSLILAQIPTWKSNRHRKPHIYPKGNSFLFTSHPGSDSAFTISGNHISTLPAVWAPNPGVIFDSSRSLIHQSQAHSKCCQLDNRTLHESDYLSNSKFFFKEW